MSGLGSAHRAATALVRPLEIRLGELSLLENSVNLNATMSGLEVPLPAYGVSA